MLTLYRKLGPAALMISPTRATLKTRKPLRMFPISNTGKDSLASNWCIVYLFGEVHRNDVGLFAGFI
jgi:hypothetical protein